VGRQRDPAAPPDGLGGPAVEFAEQFKTQFDGSVAVVPHWQVANAIGCALARTTSEINLFVDTAQQLAVASGEQFNGDIPSASRSKMQRRWP
jgi:N-methylhydantoinase A